MLEHKNREVSEKILSRLKDRDQSSIGLGETVDHDIKAAENFLVSGLTTAPCGRALGILGFRRLDIQRYTCRDIIVKSGTIEGLS